MAFPTAADVVERLELVLGAFPDASGVIVRPDDCKPDAADLPLFVKPTPLSATRLIHGQLLQETRIYEFALLVTEECDTWTADERRAAIEAIYPLLTSVPAWLFQHPRLQIVVTDPDTLVQTRYGALVDGTDPAADSGVIPLSYATQAYLGVIYRLPVRIDTALQYE